MYQRIEPSTSRSARENSDGIWSEACREVEALVRSNEKSSCSSRHDVFVNERKSFTGTKHAFFLEKSVWRKPC